MNIVFKSNKQMSFWEIKFGQVFINNNDEIYIKACSYDGTIEAVRLVDGNAFTFNDDDEFVVVDTTLYVGDYNE